MQNTDHEGISPESYCRIYDAAMAYWGRADAPFDTAALAIYAGEGKDALRDIDYFCNHFCEKVSASGGRQMFRIGPEAEAAYERIRPQRAEESDSTADAAEQAQSGEAFVSEPVSPDVRNDGLPNPSEYSPTSRAASLGKVVMPAAPAPHKVISTPPPPPLPVPKPLSVQLNAMDTLTLLRQAGVYKRSGDSEKYTTAKRILQTRNDLPNNPYYRPPQISHPSRPGELGVDISPMCHKHGYSDGDYVYLDQGVFMHIKNDRDWRLENFAQTLVDRKIRSNRSWQPLLYGRKPHDIIVERIVVRDNTSIIWVSARAVSNA